MKKKLLSLAMLCAVAFTSNAQTDKGDNMIGGSIYYTNTKRMPQNLNVWNSMDQTNFGIIPRFGHFVNANLAIGLSAGFSRSKALYESNIYTGTSTLVSSSETTSKNFNAGPFVRYYVNIVDKFKFFGQANAFVGFGNSTSQDGGSVTAIPRITKYKTTTYSAAVNPGFAFFPTKRWAFEFSFPLLTYNKYKMKDDGNNLSSQAYENESFQFGFDSFIPSLGLNYHF